MTNTNIDELITKLPTEEQEYLTKLKAEEPETFEKIAAQTKELLSIYARGDKAAWDRMKQEAEEALDALENA